jgi:vacuolar-type H+-ATPase subunit H
MPIMTRVENVVSLLEVIRRHEAELKRRLAVERETVEVVLAEAERQAQEVLIAAEEEGRCVGEGQRRAAQAQAESEAQSIVARAHTEAEALQRLGQRPLTAASARAVEIVIGGGHEA